MSRHLREEVRAFQFVMTTASVPNHATYDGHRAVLYERMYTSRWSATLQLHRLLQPVLMRTPELVMNSNSFVGRGAIGVQLTYHPRKVSGVV